MSISADILTSYKKIDEEYIDRLLGEEIAASNKKLVVLDDDPTGVQTVHDILSIQDGTETVSGRDLRRGTISFTCLPTPGALRKSRRRRLTMRLRQW